MGSSLAKDSRKLKALLLRERERKAKERIGFPKGPKSALEEVPMTVKKSIHERQQAKLHKVITLMISKMAP